MSTKKNRKERFNVKLIERHIDENSQFEHEAAAECSVSFEFDTQRFRDRYVNVEVTVWAEITEDKDDEFVPFSKMPPACQAGGSLPAGYNAHYNIRTITSVKDNNEADYEESEHTIISEYNDMNQKSIKAITNEVRRIAEGLDPADYAPYI